MSPKTDHQYPPLERAAGRAFGSAAKGLFTRDVVYYELSPSGKVTHEVWFEAPYHCMLHDFGVTRDYAVFPLRWFGARAHAAVDR
ncbi:MAG TPA: carotenoid oxygenase family protein [Steroidobacteraceae bacterium]|nr:carotenoid oxygenase family protein [Steroidobacteraceae bacterium]